MSQKKADENSIREEIIREPDGTDIDENENIEQDDELKETAEEKAAEKAEETAEEKADNREVEIESLKNQVQRLAAEFDNYKKRTAREKERIYTAALAEVVSDFLPVLDNVERALCASENADDQCIRDGVQLISRQMRDILSNMGVEPIETIGKPFNPELHEAVMHIEDEAYGDNEIIEEFQKGYIYKDEVIIRHSVVKVAN